MRSCLISVVSPVYSAEKIVGELVKRITKEVLHITDSFEIILVEDGSPDNSWNAIEQVCVSDSRVRGIKLSRNFGQHFAITAGIENAKGDYIVVIDCDLQDDPKYIIQLYEKCSEGNDIVYTVKTKRAHSFFKNLTAKVFHAFFTYLTDDKSRASDKNVGSYSIINRKVADAFCNFNDYRRHYLMVLRWLGYKTAYLEIEHMERFEGRSSYNMSKLILHAIDGITSQSDKLLRLNVGVGIGISFLSFLAVIVIVILYFVMGFMSGWASLIITILFSTGVILTSIGIAGIYISKTFEQTKNRPKYLIQEFLNKVD
jgi:dolichol-phosphate mannosyltransferase